MPKAIQFEGKSYNFPDDANDQEILGFLDQQTAPKVAPRPAPKPAPQPSAMPDIMDTFARAPGIVQQANAGGTKAVETLTAPMAPASLRPAPKPFPAQPPPQAQPGPSLLGSLKRGADSLALTAETGLYSVLKPAFSSIFGEAATAPLDTNFRRDLNAHNAMPSDPGVMKVGQAFADGGLGDGVNPLTNFIFKLGSAGKAAFDNPTAIPHLLAEGAPSMSVGIGGGKVVESVGAKLAERFAAPIIEKSAFGAGMAGGSVVANTGANVAQEQAMDPNATLADIVTRGITKTAGQLPGAMTGGALLPVRPFRAPPLAVRIAGNALTQAGIQGGGAMASVAGGNAALGRETSPTELATAGVAGAAFAPLDMAAQLFAARKMAGAFGERVASGAAAPEGVSPVMGREPAAHPDTGFMETPDGVVMDADRNPVSFGDVANGDAHLNAAKFAARNQLGGSHDLAVMSDENGGAHVVLKRRPAPPVEQPIPPEAVEPVPAEEPSPAPSVTPEPAEAAPPVAEPPSVGEAPVRGAAQPMVADALPSIQEGPINEAQGTPGRNEGPYPGPPLQNAEGQGQSPAAQDDIHADAALGNGGHVGSNDAGKGSPADLRQEVGGDGGALEDASGIGSDEKGGYRDTFTEASYTNRPSVYEGAMRAVGLTPEKFRLLPPQHQARHLTTALQKLTGVTVDIDPTMPKREAIDQLLDAHQTLQGMAQVLGISPSAIGLGGKLSLSLKKNAKFLGAFQPGANKIFLPGRSNSFAHEWAHALDFHLVDKLAGGDARGISGKIRNDGAYFAPANISEAFVHLLNTMFYGKEDLALRVMDLEKKIASTSSGAQRASFQAQLDRIKAGNSRAGGIDSDLYKGAKSLNAMQGGGDYWTQPTEMFARSVEAYVSMMAERQGFGTEFIGKGDANYKSAAEQRFELSFPHMEEREQIFAALDRVFAELASESAIDGDTGPAQAVRGDISRLSDFDRRVADQPNGNVMKRQMDELRRAAARKAREEEGRARDPKSVATKVQDSLANVFFSMSGELLMLSRRHNSPAIMKLHDLLAWEPGKARYVADTFHEEVTSNRNRWLNRLGNVMKANGFEKGLTADQASELRTLLTNTGAATGSPELTKLAGSIRQMYDALWYELKNAGYNVGFVQDQGYVNRVLDIPRIMFDEPAFLTAAAEAYGHVFDRDVGADAAAVIGKDKVDDFQKIAKVHGIAGLSALKAARKALKAAQAAGDAQGEATALQALTAAITAMHDRVKAVFGESSAEAWHANIMGADASPYDVDAHMAGSAFAKSRKLTKEADEILSNFYIQDPTESFIQYANGVTRRVAYAKRFGAKGEKLTELLEQMQSQGVLKEDAERAKQIAMIATGRSRSKLSRSTQETLSWIHAYGTLRLLPRAVLSSLSEVFTAGMTSGNALHGFQALGSQLAGVKTIAGRDRAELSEAIGLIVAGHSDEVAEARFGGIYSDDPRVSRMLSAMFQRTGLTGLTRAQQRATLAISSTMLTNLSRRILDGGDKEAEALMTELGIREPATFAAEWERRGGKVEVEDVETKFGQDISLFMRRFSNLTIQSPDPMSRPALANSPVGRIIYGIMSFSMSWWRNVAKRQFKMTVGKWQRSGPVEAIRHATLGVLPAAAAMFIASAIVSTTREWLLNNRRWNDLKDKGELEKTMAQIALSRTFSLGIGDPIVQGYTGLRYQRDLSNMMIGPVPGVVFQDLQTIAMGTVRNSEKTNTAEFNRERAIYNMLIGPAVSAGLAALPGGPILGPLEGLGAGLVTSPQAGNAAAELTVGDKGSKTDADGNVTGPPHKKGESAHGRPGRHGARSSRASGR
jgi:hypothetical protein